MFIFVNSASEAGSLCSFELKENVAVFAAEVQIEMHWTRSGVMSRMHAQTKSASMISCA